MPARARLIVWSSPNARSLVTVTVELPPASAIAAGLTATVSEASSSSVIVTVVGVTVSPLALPFTATVSSGSSMASSVGSSEKVALAVDMPAGRVIVKGATAVKSVPAVAVPEPTLTVTALSAEKVVEPPSVAVTLTIAALAASSATLVGAAVRAMVVGGSSSSMMVSPALLYLAPSQVISPE